MSKRAPLIKQVMRGGQRLAPVVKLADIRCRAAVNLQQLPEALRQLQEPSEYEVEISTPLQQLAEQVDDVLLHRQAACKGE